jgi:hypothetical protein
MAVDALRQDSLESGDSGCPNRPLLKELLVLGRCNSSGADKADSPAADNNQTAQLGKPMKKPGVSSIWHSSCHRTTDVFP